LLYADVLNDLEQSGYSPQDVWDGIVNLYEVVKQFELLKKGATKHAHYLTSSDTL
jgi:hypothetical protein